MAPSNPAGGTPAPPRRDAPDPDRSPGLRPPAADSGGPRVGLHPTKPTKPLRLSQRQATRGLTWNRTVGRPPSRAARAGGRVAAVQSIVDMCNPCPRTLLLPISPTAHPGEAADLMLDSPALDEAGRRGCHRGLQAWQPSRQGSGDPAIRKVGAQPWHALLRSAARRPPGSVEDAVGLGPRLR